MKFELYKDDAGEYRWRLVAANGEPIAVSSEGYTRKVDAVKSIHLVQSASEAPVVEE